MAVAKYTEIYIALRARIEGGRYAFRQFLPSEKALTAEFGVTRNTLRKALRHLSSQGYVQSMQGRGVQVIYRPRTSPRIFLSNIESFAEASERMGMTPRTAGKMLGSAQMIRFIQRDEITHLLLFQNMINSVRTERPDLFTPETEAKIYDMFERAGELEIKWGKYITQNQIMGFTDDIIEQYIRYLIDQRLVAIGLKHRYNVQIGRAHV